MEIEDLMMRNQLLALENERLKTENLALRNAALDRISQMDEEMDATQKESNDWKSIWHRHMYGDWLKKNNPRNVHY
jgi:hypothetical protein